jgi:hypothetical protein
VAFVDPFEHLVFSWANVVKTVGGGQWKMKALKTFCPQQIIADKMLGCILPHKAQ